MLTATEKVGEFGSFGTNLCRGSRGTGGVGGHVWVAKEGFRARGSVVCICVHQAY